MKTLIDILTAQGEGFTLADRAKALAFVAGLLTCALLAELINNL